MAAVCLVDYHEEWCRADQQEAQEQEDHMRHPLHSILICRCSAEEKQGKYNCPRSHCEVDQPIMAPEARQVAHRRPERGAVKCIATGPDYVRGDKGEHKQGRQQEKYAAVEGECCLAFFVAKR